jgi:hypothetical protein
MLGLPQNVKEGAVDECILCGFIHSTSKTGGFYSADRVLVRVCPSFSSGNYTSIARDSSVKIQVSTRCFKYNHLKSRYLTK